MSQARQYVTVQECTYHGKTLKSSHPHIIESDGRVYCHGWGTYLTQIDEVTKDSKWMKKVRGKWKKPDKEDETEK